MCRFRQRLFVQHFIHTCNDIHAFGKTAQLQGRSGCARPYDQEKQKRHNKGHIARFLQKQEQPDRNDKGGNRQHKHPKENIAGPDHLGHFCCEVPIADNILIELPKGFHCLPKDFNRRHPLNILDGRRTDFFQCVKVFFQPAAFQNLNHYCKLADKANHNREQAAKRQPDILRKHDNKHCKQHNNGADKIWQLVSQKGFNLFDVRIQNLFHFPNGIVRNITHWQLSDMLRHFQTDTTDDTIGKSVGHHATGIRQHISHYQTSQTIQGPTDHKICVEYRSCGCMA